jgi:AraC-like DNA-binding protein
MIVLAGLWSQRDGFMDELVAETAEGRSVSGTLANLIVGYCEQHQLVIPELCSRYAQSKRIPIKVWIAMLAAVAEQDPRPGLGLAIAARVEPKHVGILAYLSLSCHTLVEVLQHLQHYHRLAYDGSQLTVRLQADHVEISWGSDAGVLGMLADETAIGFFYTILHQLVAPHPLKLISVDFINPKPKQLDVYQQFFACPVHFGLARTCVRIDAKYLQLPLAREDSTLRAILDQQAQALLAELPKHDSFDGLLQQLLMQAVSEAATHIDDIAHQLGLSTRGLQRKLKARGYSFEQRLAQVRYTLALQYLKDPDQGLAEISVMLGYSEQSAFQRAFKGWSGQTPQQYRKDQTLV